MKIPLVVALHGATGTQGAAVARRLLSGGHRVRAVARRPHRAHGCEPFAADLLDADALAAAYAGVDAVVVQLPLVFDDGAVRQAERVAQALCRSGVRRVVVNAGGPVAPAPVGMPYVDARVALLAALDDGPFAVTVIEPIAPYMENFCAPWSAPLVRDGVLAYPLPAEAPIPWIALDDVAGAIAAALAADEPGRLPMCGPQPLTGAQTAATLGVRWETIEPAAYADMMRPHVGDQVADGVAGLYAAAAHMPPPPAPRRVGRITLAAWARAQALDPALAQRAV